MPHLIVMKKTLKNTEREREGGGGQRLGRERDGQVER